MKLWIIMAASISIWSTDNSLQSEDVSTFSPMQWNNVSFTYKTEDECEVGLLSIKQREGGRIVTRHSGAISLIREEQGHLKQVYDCTEIVLTK